MDLDNLFAFLSDVQPNRNHIIDEIGEKMNELVEDLDVELETVIQQELEGLNQEQPQPTPPRLGHPTLPEPSGPPPPPPCPPPPMTTIVESPVEEIKNKNDGEHIYEAVLPREIPAPISPPPLPAPPKLPPDSPKSTPHMSRSNSTIISSRVSRKSVKLFYDFFKYSNELIFRSICCTF